MDEGPLEILLDGPHSAAWNMALDETLLETPGAWFRVYRWWPRTLSLGYFQKVGDFERERTRLPWIRRPTGGGAILHDDEWTLSLALPIQSLGRQVSQSYLPLHRAVRSALEALGVPLAPPPSDTAPGIDSHARPRTPWCFNDPISLDLLSPDGRKVFGSAQRRRGDRVLHHGSLILSPAPETPRAGFAKPFPNKTLPLLLAQTLSQTLGLPPRLHLRLPPPLCAKADSLARTKFSAPSWNKKR